MGLRVAVATEDGMEVQHFGHATRFHVYDLDHAGIVLVGTREDVPSSAADEERAAAHQRKLEPITRRSCQRAAWERASSREGRGCGWTDVRASISGRP